MKKDKLREAVDTTKTETHDALQTVWNATNKGQRNKLLRNAEIKALLDRYGVDYGGEQS